MWNMIWFFKWVDIPEEALISAGVCCTSVQTALESCEAQSPLPHMQITAAGHDCSLME